MEKLTEQERLIIQLCAEDNTVKMTANILGISRNTVTKHWENIFSKTGMHTKPAVVWKYAALNPVRINLP